jgi:Short C-terminal domain
MPLGRDRRQRRRRAAAIGGAAVAAKKHHDAKQAEQAPEAAASEQPGPGQAAEPPAADGLTPQTLDELKQLGELHEQGVLSDEEFEREKAKLLGSA